MSQYRLVKIKPVVGALSAGLLAAAFLLGGCSKENETKQPALQKGAPAVAEKGAMVPTEMSAQQRVAMGKAIFAKKCVSCHGEEGNGSNHGPALKHRHFTYGRTAEAISMSIAKGRGEGMPALMTSLQKIEAETIVAYVLSLK